MKRSPDYGIDAPGVMRNLVVAGVAALGFGIVLGLGWLPAAQPFGLALLWMAPVCLASGLLMLLYAKWGKFRHRDRMLRRVPWRGDEYVLDVGTGLGLLVIGAAKRLTATGKAYGIDVWSARDLSATAPGATVRNAYIEGVDKRIELKTEDTRALSFPEASFDVVLSNRCLHKIEDAEGRQRACEEIARVLMPGGIAVISDFRRTGEYAASFEREGLTVVRSGPFLLDTFPPLRIVTAIKPKDAA